MATEDEAVISAAGWCAPGLDTYFMMIGGALDSDATREPLTPEEIEELRDKPEPVTDEWVETTTWVIKPNTDYYETEDVYYSLADAESAYAKRVEHSSDFSAVTLSERVTRSKALASSRGTRVDNPDATGEFPSLSVSRGGVNYGRHLA